MITQQDLMIIPEEELKLYYLEYRRRERIKKSDKIKMYHTEYNKKRSTRTRQNVHENSSKTINNNEFSQHNTTQDKRIMTQSKMEDIF